MRAFAVIGANWGDEGKGLITDWLCRHTTKPLVIRHNGGAQAGHTVVTPEGKRHVFHHFGSGTLAGAPTHLASKFIVNPILFCAELTELRQLLGAKPPRVFVDPACPVTTPYDMLANQLREKARGGAAYGSVGVGIWETVRRSARANLSITAGDDMEYIERQLPWVRAYANERTGIKFEDNYDCDALDRDFLNAMHSFRAMTLRTDFSRLLQMTRYQTLVFEGAQGLLLDNDAPGAPQHVTPSKTGLHNPREICRELGLSQRLSAIYVSRTYLTRHGAGPLPGEQPRPDWLVDNTNIDHPFQGALRYAPLDVDSLVGRCIADSGRGAHPAHMAVTHCDQLAPGLAGLREDTNGLPVIRSYGPSSEHVSAERFVDEVLNGTR